MAEEVSSMLSGVTFSCWIFFCFHVVKPVMPILPLLSVCSWETLLDKNMSGQKRNWMRSLMIFILLTTNQFQHLSFNSLLRNKFRISNVFFSFIFNQVTKIMSISAEKIVSIYCKHEGNIHIKTEHKFVFWVHRTTNAAFCFAQISIATWGVHTLLFCTPLSAIHVLSKKGLGY